MSTHRHIDAICMSMTVLTLLIALLFMNGRALGLWAVASEEADSLFTQNDLNASWDTTGATMIALSDAGSRVTGNGAYVYEGDIHIVYAGKYILTGELSSGTIYVEANGDDKVYLMLDGAIIHGEGDAALHVEQADKVFLTLREGTQNELSATLGEESVAQGVDGAIYSRDDLSINGAGTLTITSQDQHGIVCNDDLVIAGGTLSITAGQDAIHANDSVRIREADITLTAGDDGITVSNDDGTAFLYMESGTVRIPACYEGLEAVEVIIAGGVLEITPTDDGINASSDTGKPLIAITGGEITIINENGRDADGLDSNGDISISGGKLLISVSDRGGSCAIDFGGTCLVSGGTVLACGSSGMAQGFDSSSPQGFLMYNTSAEAGTAVAIQDAAGNVLFSEEVPCSFSSVLVSTPEMSVGDVCTLVIGEEETEMTIDNTSSARGFGRGQMPGNGFGGRQRGAMGSNYRTTGTDAQPSAEGTPPTDTQPTEKGINDGQSPDMPEGGFGMTPPDVPQGDMPSMERTWPETNGNRVIIPLATDNASSAVDTAPRPTQEMLLLLGLSVAVLLCGCAIALFYRKRA